MRFCELREKIVVNTKNGCNLGKICDLKIDHCSGKVRAIIVPGPYKICCFFGSNSEYVIPFDCIVHIGPDVVLVDICEEKFLVSKE